EPYKDVLRVRHLNLFEEEPLLNELPQTHIFHLPCGKCTIILEDVSLQIGVNVNDLPITRPTFFIGMSCVQNYWDRRIRCEGLLPNKSNNRVHIMYLPFSLYCNLDHNYNFKHSSS
ncbi:hypothetical protein Lal_00042449, partial [Lupinus albus]